VSINEADMRYHLEGMQRLLNDLDSDYRLTIRGKTIWLSGKGIPRTPITGAASIAKYLDEKLTEYYNK
jgi:hypothetical protein